jgi:hypothetical protein
MAGFDGCAPTGVERIGEAALWIGALFASLGGILTVVMGRCFFWQIDEEKAEINSSRPSIVGIFRLGGVVFAVGLLCGLFGAFAGALFATIDIVGFMLTGGWEAGISTGIAGVLLGGILGTAIAATRAWFYKRSISLSDHAYTR